MKEYCIYLHRNKINGKVYIGQTCQKPEKRWNYGHGYKNCPRFYSAIVSYGWNNFEHIILENNLTSDEANEKEQYYIKKYNSQNPDLGYNLTEGGSSLSEYWKTAEHRELQSQNRKLYFKEHPDKKIENNKHLKEIAQKSAKRRSEKMKENYANQGGLFHLNETRKKSIKCVETNEIFTSLSEASKKYNISIGNISSVIHGKRKSAGGYHWIEL